MPPKSIYQHLSLQTGESPVTMRYAPYPSSTVCYLCSNGNCPPPCHPERSRGIFAPNICQAASKCVDSSTRCRSLRMTRFVCRDKQNLPRGYLRGKRKKCWYKASLSRFPLRPPEESEEHTEVPRRLFAYFLVGEKVGPRRDHMQSRFFDSLRSFRMTGKRIATSLRSSQ